MISSLSLRESNNCLPRQVRQLPVVRAQSPCTSSLESLHATRNSCLSIFSKVWSGICSIFRWVFCCGCFHKKPAILTHKQIDLPDGKVRVEGMVNGQVATEIVVVPSTEELVVEEVRTQSPTYPAADLILDAVRDLGGKSVVVTSLGLALELCKKGMVSNTKIDCRNHSSDPLHAFVEAVVKVVQEQNEQNLLDTEYLPALVTMEALLQSETYPLKMFFFLPLIKASELAVPRELTLPAPVEFLTTK